MIPITLSRKRIITWLAALIIVVMALYLWRDLRLSDTKNVPLPDIVVENIVLNRTIDGKKWKLVSPRVEHKDGLVYGRSLDVTITDNTDTRTFISSANGIFSRVSNDVELTDVHGVLTKVHGKTYNLSAGTVNYDSSGKKWIFKNKVNLTDGRMEISAPNGYFDTASGQCVLSGRGMLTW